MTNKDFDRLAKLEDHVGKLQFLLDEGIDMMQTLQESQVKLIKAIQEHKYYISDINEYNLQRTEHDEKLWQIIEDLK